MTAFLESCLIATQNWVLAEYIQHAVASRLVSFETILHRALLKLAHALYVCQLYNNDCEACQLVVGKVPTRHA